MARERANALRQLRGAAATLRSRGKRAALNTWLEMAGDRTTALSRLDAAARSLRNRGLRAALNGWTMTHSQRCEALHALRRAASGFRQRGLRAAANTWFSARAERVEALRQLRRAAGSLRQRGLRASLNTWVALLRERAEARRRLRETVAAFGGGGKRRGFFKWQSATLGARRARVEQRALDRRQFGYALLPGGVPRHVIELVLRRSTGLSHSWERWRALGELPKVERAAAGRRRRGSLRRGLSAWVAYAQSGTLRRLRAEREALRDSEAVLASEVTALEDEAADAAAHWRLLEVEVQRLIGYSPLKGLRRPNSRAIGAPAGTLPVRRS